MRKSAKLVDKKNKDKNPEELRQDTIECYESTIVNYVVNWYGYYNGQEFFERIALAGFSGEGFFLSHGMSSKEQSGKTGARRASELYSRLESSRLRQPFPLDVLVYL
jgi:hypothetical protein